MDCYNVGRFARQVVSDCGANGKAGGKYADGTGSIVVYHA